MKEISGSFQLADIANARIAIIVADFNETVTRQLKEGAVKTLLKFGLTDNQINVYHVPGAFEIPFTVKRLLSSGQFNGMMTLGAVIKGDTAHYDLICQNVTSAIMQLNLQGDVPVTFGLLTTDNIEQALQRAGLKMGNEGAETAISLLEMISLNKQI
ncbi:6,7-dimethyl-8-ribityllumazine synthase [uncultured Limosilactobacillus sp.]|uniref:6,7-dimethyl-8-ribityllumazine synthase n=1 Tax=uncultured Limosilactobacillus sp. TaxID=2837629 RepID=UPI0025E5E2E3|nr:6,7-dimethyl-8-ribityllumazine synthase [uncultured Limosilactobacillus sp.]